MRQPARTAPSSSVTRALLAAAAVLAPFALAAQGIDAAQDIDVAALQELDDDRSDVIYEGFTIEEIEDMELVRDGEVIGEVEAVLAGPSGDVTALAVEYDDEGLGDSDVVVPIDRLELATDEREVRTTLSDAELAALPSWDD